MKFVFNKKYSFLLFLILCWLGIIASINSSYNDLNLLNLSFFNILNFLRYLSPVFIFSLFFILILRNINNIKINYIFILFLTLGLVQFVSFFVNGYSVFDFEKYHILLCYLSVIFILIFSIKYDLKIKFLYIIFLILLTAVITVYVYELTKQTLILGNINYFYFVFGTGSLQNNEIGIIGQQNPRATGLSRQMVVLFCFLFYFLLTFKKKDYIYYIVFLTLFILAFFIWGLQSRGSLICWFVVWIVFLFFDKLKLKNKIKLLILLFFIPISMFEYSMNVQNDKISSLTDNKKKEILINKNRLFPTENFQVEIEIKDEITGQSITKRETDYTTGRIYIWKRALKKFYEKPVIGYGPQGDRIALTKDKSNISSNQKHIWDNNASNAFFYIGLSAGSIGIFILSIIYFSLTYYIFKSLFLLKIFKSNNFFIKNCVTILIMFMTRSIYENSFVVFSIDYILVMLSIISINKFTEKNNLKAVS